MRLRLSFKTYLFWISIFIFGSTVLLSAQELMKAKIGVEIFSKNQTFPAKQRVRLGAEDTFRVYIMPEKDCYVYVINSDQKKATLLNPENKSQLVKKGSLKFYPSSQNHFQLDNTAKKEYITVICSPKKLKEISDLFATGFAPFDKWSAMEQEFVKVSRISLNEKIEKPLPIAGSLRSDPKSLEEKMHTSSGKTLLIKRYEFHVK